MNYIKPFIYRAGKNMKEISWETGINPVKLSRIVNNHQEPKLSEALRILRVMKRYIPDITLTDIFPDVETDYFVL